MIAVFVGVSAPALRAGCKGAAEVPAARAVALRSLLSGSNAATEFHLYAAAPSADARLQFLLYSIRKTGDPTALHTVYLAAVAEGPEERVFFTHDVSAYLPAFAHTPIVAPAETPAGVPRRPEMVVDGCLNTFILQPNTQAIHLNLFAKWALSRTAVANDILFVLPENGFVAPVLELNQTSWQTMPDSHSPMHSDSILAIFPSATGASHVIWQRFSRQSAGSVLAASNVENGLYRWEEKSFRKVGTLTPEDLAERLKNAVPLTRSDAIVPVRLEYKMPGPNQPPP